MRSAKLATWTLVPLLTLLSGAPAAALEKPTWQEIDAQALVERCWALSQEDRDSGVTGRMREGTARTAQCFENEIVQHGAKFLHPQTMNEEEIRQTLVEIGAPYGHLYLAIYNGHEGCAEGGCGTIHQVLPVVALANLYETILRDLIAQRNDYLK